MKEVKKEHLVKMELEDQGVLLVLLVFLDQKVIWGLKAQVGFPDMLALEECLGLMRLKLPYKEYMTYA